jgi:ribosome-associated toxin RatA of RatAB toxin-antitoxin module
MADQTTQSIEIAAPADRVMAVISDLPSYPDWADGIKQAEVLSTDADGRPVQARFVLEKAVVKDEYTLEYDWAGDGLSVRWRLIKGQMQKAQTGSYTLTARGDRTTVTYTLSVELSIPMIGLLRRKAEKVIIDTALKELKRRVEEGR